MLVPGTFFQVSLPILHTVTHAPTQMYSKFISCFIILSVCVSFLESIGVELLDTIRYNGVLAGDSKGLSGQLRPCPCPCGPYPPNVRALSFDMNMADVQSRCRKVICPKCHTRLLEPPETEIYDCPTCLTCLQAKGTSSNARKKALQCLSNDVNDSTSQKPTSQHEASSVDDSETQGQDQHKEDERKVDMPKDESIRKKEQIETVLVGKEEDSQFQCYSAPSANLSKSNSSSRNSSGRNVAASKDCELAGEAEASRDLLMQQGILEEKGGTHFSFQGKMTGDGLVCESVCVNNTGKRDEKETVIVGINCSIPSTSTGKNVLAGECAGVVETYQEEGNHSNDKNDPKFESEIIRDNDCELSFKYIASSLKSNVHLAEKKRTHRLAKLSSEASGGQNQEITTTGLSSELPTLNIQSSDDYESYSSFSESPSHHGSDSEFDFPAPSAESILSAKLSETFLKPKTPEGPHQLEWQDVDFYNISSNFQESNSSTASSIGVVSEVASNMVAQVEPGAKEEITEGGLHIKNDPSTIIVSRSLDVTTETASSSLRALREMGTVSGKPDCDDKEGFLVDSRSGRKLDLQGESKQSSRTSVEQISREHLQPSGTDPSSSTLLGDKKMKTYCTVEEDADLIKSVAMASKNPSTSSLQDNVVDTLGGMKRRERTAAGPIAAIRGDAEYDRSDLRKELDSSGVQLLNVAGKVNVSQSGIKSKGHHQQEYLGKEVQFHNRGVVKMTDSKWHHNRSYSSDAAQMLNSEDVATSSGTYEHPGNIHDEDLYVPAARTLEGSLRAHERHGQGVATMPAGRSLQLQSLKVDQPIQIVDDPSIYPARSQSFQSNVYFDASKSLANTVCSYQAPAHPLMLSLAMHGHACSCQGCHPVGPVCMPYVCGQHSLAPQLHMPCSLCLRTMGHYQGHTDLGNFYQGFQVQASCMPCHSPACFSQPIAHMQETPIAAAKPPMPSVVRKPKLYPPLPQGRTAPYVVCTGCNDILELPVYFPVSHQAQKLRCGRCGKVSKFSVPENINKSHIVGWQSSAAGLTRKSSTSSPPSFEFMVRNRELPVSDLGQSTDSSYARGLQNQRGSISSRHYNSSGHHSLQSDLTFKVKPSQDEPNSKLPTGSTNHSSQDDFFFRSLSRKSEFDSPRSLFRGFQTMSARFGVSNVYNDGLLGSDDVPSQCAVDEKEEGLDFGAPRPSDGESLDQRSPESRMRSPENFESVHQSRHRSFGDEETCKATEIQQDFGSEHNSIAQERSSTSLFALLNQESTKFEINLENRVLYEEGASSLWSPGSKSPVHNYTNQSSTSREKEIGRARNLRAAHFVKKGQRYLAAMLTRSLKHRVNN